MLFVLWLNSFTPVGLSEVQVDFVLCPIIEIISIKKNVVFCVISRILEYLNIGLFKIDTQARQGGYLNKKSAPSILESSDLPLKALSNFPNY